ncbi:MULTISPECIES: hypothetical protein [unclassified Helicobacter]|uniref:hypothetical protein n=1 Tax=unclassified Helicobacter TaxID=2593540 RepID=UPI000CF04D01|nr:MULTISPECIES: hypothetical protein [unclassified Helicobacter]
MKSKVFSSLVLSTVVATGAHAVDINFFGHIGGAYNQGLTNGNKAPNDKASYGGVTGHLGIDFGFNALHLGVGAYGSFPIYGTSVVGFGNQADMAYSKDYADLSDLYIKYDTTDLVVAAGRFNNEFLESSWTNAYMQGVASRWKTRYFGVWLGWMNDFTTYGYAPNRIASELMSYHRFPSSFTHFGFGNEVFVGGLNFDFKFLKINPFMNYFFRDKGNDSILAGTDLSLIFGEGGVVQTTTAFNFLWQNTFGVSKDDTMLFMIDEELLFGGIFKLGGGFLATTGGNGIRPINDATRFYGGKFLTPNYGYYGSANYFFQKNNTWYVFTGVKSRFFDLDVLYADGDYHEFSAIASFTVFDKQVKGSLNGIALKIGGGYVNNGFKSSRFQRSNAIGFVKLSY